jgi:hypothetical protein
VGDSEASCDYLHYRAQIRAATAQDPERNALLIPVAFSRR